MPPPRPEDFSRDELDRVAATLQQRYGQPVMPEPVEVELALAADSDAPSPCPALYWQQRGAEFVVVKLGPGRFRTQFFYADGEQFGTGREEYSSLDDCVVSVLRVQSDDERRRVAAGSGSRAEPPPDYDGPIVI